MEWVAGQVPVSAELQGEVEDVDVDVGSPPVRLLFLTVVAPMAEVAVDDVQVALLHEGGDGRVKMMHTTMRRRKA